jgi:hypothetical protein
VRGGVSWGVFAVAWAGSDQRGEIIYGNRWQVYDDNPNPLIGFALCPAGESCPPPNWVEFDEPRVEEIVLSVCTSSDAEACKLALKSDWAFLDAQPDPMMSMGKVGASRLSDLRKGARTDRRSQYGRRR